MHVPNFFPYLVGISVLGKNDIPRPLASMWALRQRLASLSVQLNVGYSEPRLYKNGIYSYCLEKVSKSTVLL